jgi:hypothetical protein
MISEVTTAQNYLRERFGENPPPGTYKAPFRGKYLEFDLNEELKLNFKGTTNCSCLENECCSDCENPKNDASSSTDPSNEEEQALGLSFVGGSFSTQSSIPALVMEQKGGQKLTLDQHPINGRARIKVERWSLEDDGWGGEEMEYNGGAMVLSLEECIQLRDQLVRRIAEGGYCCREKQYRCQEQCGSCYRIQAGLPD